MACQRRPAATCGKRRYRRRHNRISPLQEILPLVHARPELGRAVHRVHLRDRHGRHSLPADGGVVAREQRRKALVVAKDWDEDATSCDHVLRGLAAGRRVARLNSVSTRKPQLSSRRDLSPLRRKLRQFSRGPVTSSTTCGCSRRWLCRCPTALWPGV